MDLKTIPTEQLVSALQVEKDRENILMAFRNYKGKDEIITDKQLKEAVAARPDLPKIKSLIPSLDYITGGFEEGELVIISGPTGNGKTQLLTTLVQNIYLQNHLSLLLSFEVTDKDLLRRFAGSSASFVLPKRNETPTSKWLQHRVWEAVAKHEAKAVFIDHLHYLITPDQLKTGSSSLMIGEIMRDLKRLALQTRTTVFLVCHMTKLSLDSAPNINDLRDSSFIGQEADTVMFIWREILDDKVRNKAPVYTNNSHLKVEKNRREGRLGQVKLTLTGSKFHEATGGGYE